MASGAVSLGKGPLPLNRRILGGDDAAGEFGDLGSLELPTVSVRAGLPTGETEDAAPGVAGQIIEEQLLAITTSQIEPEPVIMKPRVRLTVETRSIPLTGAGINTEIRPLLSHFPPVPSLGAASRGLTSWLDQFSGVVGTEAATHVKQAIAAIERQLATLAAPEQGPDCN